MTLLSRLFLLVGIAMLPAVALQATHEYDLRRSRWEETRTTTMHYTELMAAEQARIVDGAKQFVTALAQTRSVRTFDSERCHAYFDSLLRQFPQYALIDAMDVTGQGMCAGPTGSRNNVADRTWFKRAIELNGLAVGDYVFGKQSRKHSLHVSHPLHADDGSIVGVVGAAISLDWLNGELARRTLPPGMVLVIADRNGTVIARRPEGESWIGKPLPPNLKSLLDDETAGTVETEGLDGRTRIVSYLPLRAANDDLFVAVGLDRTMAFTDLNASTWRGVALIGVGLLLALLCAWIGARAFLMVPVRRMEAAVQRWKQGDLSARTGLPGDGDELSALGCAFDEVATALQDREVRRAQVAAALRESEDHYRNAVELNPQVAWTADSEGAVQSFGERWLHLTGLTREEALGDGWIRVSHPDDRPLVAAAWAESLRTGTPCDVEHRVRLADGCFRWMRSRAYPRRGPSGTILRWYGTTENIQEHKLQAQALADARDDAVRAWAAAEAARAAAERADFGKSKFLAAAAHDLRQPLQSLFFFSAALAEQVQDDRSRRTLGMLDRSLETLKALLDSLLNVSHLDSGAVTPEITVFPMDRLIDEIRDTYTPAAAAQGLRFVAVGCGSICVRSDANLLGRVVRNFVENALRYTKQGQIRVECHATGDTARIEVRDTGIGIPADELERIFEEFHQVGNSERDRSQGLGLGLAIVKRIAQLLGHRLRVKSTEGVGSVFAIEVPVAVPEAEPELKPAPEADSVQDALAPETGRRRLVLLVDDDAIVLLGLQAMFQSWGDEVLIAASADQAMEKLEADGRRPDLVVADYRLREGRIGTEVILRVRERFGRDVPGMLLTGENGPECQHDAADHGLGLAHKPVTPRQLQSTLDRFMVAAQ